MTVTNVTPPTLSGSTQQGGFINTSNGTWTYSLDYLSYTYQWERCDAGGANCVDIPGATAASYQLTAADVGGTVRSRVTATEHASPGLSISPPQPGAVIYNSDAPSSYAHAGAMVDMNSSESSGAIAVSVAGGHVLVYVDVIVSGSGGNYTSLINNANIYGPAIGLWPGQTSAYNGYGYVRDIATLVTSGKLEAVLEKVVSDNPHMAGFFADDLGTSNSQYKSPMATQGNGYSIPTQTFYDAVIAVLQVFRNVCDAHQLIFLTNGLFDGRGNGGYPTRNQHGCSLCEGTTAEHHTSDGGYWTQYMAATQWANDSPITSGQALGFAIVSPGDTSWRGNSNIAWISEQTSYSSAPNPWSGFHATGLPTHAS